MSISNKINSNKRYILWGLSVVCMLTLMIYIASSGFLPVKYVVLLMIAVVLIHIGLFTAQKKQGKTRFVISALIEIAIIGVSCYGISVLHHTSVMMQEITETVVETESISAYVMKKNEDKFHNLNDASDSAFGIITIQGYEASMQVLQRLSNETGKELNILEYSDMFMAVDALKDNDIQVLMLNDAFAALISEVEGYEWFVEDAVVISSVLEEVQIVVSPTPTNTPDSNPADDTEEISDDGEIISDEEKTTIENTASTEKMELMEAPEQVDWNALVNQEMLPVPEGSFVVYISGADTWGKASTKSRSDVNILAVVNTNTKNILLVSTPRDYYVPLAVSNGVKDKLTHAGIYGTDNSMQTLSMLYGVNIQYYAKFNFTGFVQIIDAIGGIDVYSDTAFTVGDAFAYSQGVNHLDGISALAFARERYNVAGGDIGRGTHQMEVIKAVINKCMSSAILSNYAGVMNSVSGCFSTNMSKETIASLVRMQLGDMSQWNISSISVSGNGDYKTTYSIPGMTSYVMIPNDASVENAKAAIANVLQ